MWHKQALYLVVVNGHGADRFRRSKFQQNKVAKGQKSRRRAVGYLPSQVGVAKQP